jgi:hypothetical protein
VGRNNRLDVGAVRPLTHGFSVAPWPAHIDKAIPGIESFNCVGEEAPSVASPPATVPATGRGPIPCSESHGLPHSSAYRISLA